MRVWDVDPALLCRQHLLGEHRELHGLWNVLTKHGGRGGYSAHPETLRWVGKLGALAARHGALAREIAVRGYAHRSDLDLVGVDLGSHTQDVLLHSVAEQARILRGKRCACARRLGVARFQDRDPERIDALSVHFP